ncbi:unnamed protein product [Tilletia controversa]|nr:unnamed protein product [Tilletia controversa]
MARSSEGHKLLAYVAEAPAGSEDPDAEQEAEEEAEDGAEEGAGPVPVESPSPWAPLTPEEKNRLSAINKVLTVNLVVGRLWHELGTVLAFWVQWPSSRSC